MFQKIVYKLVPRLNKKTIVKAETFKGKEINLKDVTNLAFFVMRSLILDSESIFTE